MPGAAGGPSALCTTSPSELCRLFGAPRPAADAQHANTSCDLHGVLGAFRESVSGIARGMKFAPSYLVRWIVPLLAVAPLAAGAPAKAAEPFPTSPPSPSEGRRVAHSVMTTARSPRWRPTARTASYQTLRGAGSATLVVKPNPSPLSCSWRSSCPSAVLRRVSSRARFRRHATRCPTRVSAPVLHRPSPNAPPTRGQRVSIPPAAVRHGGPRAPSGRKRTRWLDRRKPERCDRASQLDRQSQRFDCARGTADRSRGGPTCRARTRDRDLGARRRRPGSTRRVTSRPGRSAGGFAQRSRVGSRAREDPRRAATDARGRAS